MKLLICRFLHAIRLRSLTLKVDYIFYRWARLLCQWLEELSPGICSRAGFPYELRWLQSLYSAEAANWEQQWFQRIYQEELQLGGDEDTEGAAAWPHELSGGMAQRVVIAMALVGEPKIIIADEATSALDASVRTRVLELLKNKSRERNITLLLISHDLAAVRMFCDQIAVIYAGRVVELGPAKTVFANPVHPYTKALMSATAGHEKPGETLHTIPGIPPQLREASAKCAFAPRCTKAVNGLCDIKRPEPESIIGDRTVLCLRWQDLIDEYATEAAEGKYGTA